LNLTACVLGQIYTDQLKFWGDEAIVAINPNLNETARNTTIRAARRVRGSSDTDSITRVSLRMRTRTNE